MAVHKINRTTERVLPEWVPHEYILDSSDDVSALPDDAPVGSYAYSLDHTIVKIMGGSGWTTIENAQWTFVVSESGSKIVFTSVEESGSD